jgi:hypothetical protein
VCGGAVDLPVEVALKAEGSALRLARRVFEPWPAAGTTRWRVGALAGVGPLTATARACGAVVGSSWL